ncbi:MAG: nicotinate (nicotinamide) nucleotide adenylyltransferase [Anaeroplasma sp.]
MKIGVYGGSFNPCHLMHKKLVLSLLENDFFDRIIVVPTGNYYKKSNLLKGEERIKMLELMFKDNPRVIICDYEFKNNLICTYRSLDYLQNMYKGDKIYFILGSDNLKSFHTWKKYEYILNNYNLLVIKRKNIDITNELEKYKSYDGEILCVDLDLDSTSSSMIRDCFAKYDDEVAAKYLDESVYKYIIQKGFYHPNYKEDSKLEYLSDEDFLKQYDSNSYEKMSITTDITLFGISDISKDNYRHLNKKAFSVLLVKRNTPPFMGKWCLPGGFLSLDETLQDCAKRVLFTETNLENIYLEQLYTFSDIDRDIRARVLSCSYLGLVDKNKINTKLQDNASFFTIKLTENDGIIIIEFKNEVESFKCKVRKIIDEYGLVEYKEVENNYIAFDNLLVIMTSINRLQNKVSYTDIVFHMMPEKFTLKELQLVYEAILDKKLLDPDFRRNIKEKVIKTDELKVGGGHRPASLYKYKKTLGDI